jgi:hypothetical protein
MAVQQLNILKWLTARGTNIPRSARAAFLVPPAIRLTGERLLALAAGEGSLLGVPPQVDIQLELVSTLVLAKMARHTFGSPSLLQVNRTFVSSQVRENFKSLIAKVANMFCGPSFMAQFFVEI